MDRSQYPVLANSQIVHLDASAAFPLHAEVITAVNQAMITVLGAPGKAFYDGAMVATQEVERARCLVADFLHASPTEVFFVASATDAAKSIAELWGRTGTVLYSPEDHSRIVQELTRRASDVCSVAYSDSGEYDYAAIRRAQPAVAVLSQLHHIYGSDNHLAAIRNDLAQAKLVIDASQSASRMPIDVAALGCDALFFSAQKVGGLAGVGVLYIASRHHGALARSRLEPNTLPLVPIISLRAALEVLQHQTLTEINHYLARMTAWLIDQLQPMPALRFSKGPAGPSKACHGHGIVSFALQGYTAQDIAMILADHDIWVRGGDHCVDPDQVDQDTVRVSLHRYTTSHDLTRLLRVLEQL